jgi:putative transposase
MQSVPNPKRQHETAKQSKADKKQLRQLEKELRRKERALAEAAALLVLRKKTQSLLRGGSRGRLTRNCERQVLIVLIKEAVTAGSRLASACQETEICLRTYRRWVKADGVVLEDQRPLTARPEPQNKLRKVEVQTILDVANAPEYTSLPPSVLAGISLGDNT